MSSPATDRCRAMLRDISHLLPQLETTLIPERATKVTKHTPPTEDQVAAFRAERAERHVLKAKYLPESAAPVNLDTVIAITDAKSSLATAYSQALRICDLPERCRRCNHLRDEHYDGAHCGLCSPCPGFAMTYRSPSDWRAWEAVLNNDSTVADTIEPHLSTALRSVEAALGGDSDARLLMELCPWCEGVTSAMPTGSYTLKAHVSENNATETFVVCHNVDCTVGEDDCGSRWRGRPMWAFHELAWLNDMIDSAKHRRMLEKRVHDMLFGPAA